MIGTDNNKKAVAKAVQGFLTSESFHDELWEHFPEGSVGTVEVSEITPLETIVRVYPARRSGAPRYFKVQVSEVM